MGIGQLRITPEILGEAVGQLPRAARVVGSAASNLYVVLLIEHEFIPDGSQLSCITSVNGLASTTAIVIGE